MTPLHALAPGPQYLSTGSLCTITPSALTHSSALRSTCRSACAERAAAGPVVLFLLPAGAPTSAAPPARERAPSIASTSKPRRAPQQAKRQRPRHAGTGQRQPHPRSRHAHPCMRRTCSAPASRGRAPGHASPVSEASARAARACCRRCARRRVPAWLAGGRCARFLSSVRVGYRLQTLQTELARLHSLQGSILGRRWQARVFATNTFVTPDVHLPAGA